jgi:hypothetical protein
MVDRAMGIKRLSKEPNQNQNQSGKTPVHNKPQAHQKTPENHN